MLLAAGLITAAVYAARTEDGRYQMSMGAAVKAIGQVFYRMRISGLTIVLAPLLPM